MRAAAALASRWCLHMPESDTWSCREQGIASDLARTSGGKREKNPGAGRDADAASLLLLVIPAQAGIQCL
jgi:hypothetical protein